jgi:hypothetical protein
MGHHVQASFDHLFDTNQLPPSVPQVVHARDVAKMRKVWSDDQQWSKTLKPLGQIVSLPCCPVPFEALVHINTSQNNLGVRSKLEHPPQAFFVLHN